MMMGGRAHEWGCIEELLREGVGQREEEVKRWRLGLYCLRSGQKCKREVMMVLMSP